MIDPQGQGSVCPASPKNTMTAQDYITEKLDKLKLSAEPSHTDSGEELEEKIFALLMTKKFRKYAASTELQAHIRQAIHLNVAHKEPINLTLLHGAYKLWRFDESPEADWAELFALMYYTNWVKPICEIYSPGVWFDFFVDDFIVPLLDNIEPLDIEKYLSSYQSVLDFLKPYQPHNLKMTVTPVGSQFDSKEAYMTSLKRNLDAIKPSGLPHLSDQEKAMVELNTKATSEQLADPDWQRKVLQLHNAYAVTKSEPGYHNQPTKIKVFTQPLPTGMVISVGSTKDSIAKFWVGVGALRPLSDSYRQIILTPSQLQTAQFTWEDVSINGLTGKNFSKVRILS